jgi:hypothetical protein
MAHYTLDMHPMPHVSPQRGALLLGTPDFEVEEGRIGPTPAVTDPTHAKAIEEEQPGR